ncbi:MAG: hypothetical protein PSV21_11145, partial [Aquabacterium sp.]|nr:hypothetical protein [Aquabacterium sp.]
RSIPRQAWLEAQTWVQAQGASDTAHPTQATGPALDPHTFLHQVMNDTSVPLALRIEAAKALLPHVPPCP